MSGKSPAYVTKQLSSLESSNNVNRREPCSCARRSLSGTACSCSDQRQAQTFVPVLSDALSYDSGFGQIPVYSQTSPRIQAKLVMTAPGDRYENEADAVVDKVMRMDETDRPPQVKQIAANGLTQRKATEPSSQSVPPIVENVLKTPGDRLDSQVQTDMGRRFGKDFSSVRIHADEQSSRSAQAIGARAYTVGRDIVFRDGEYAVSTLRGRRLIAHELVHVVQQAAHVPYSAQRTGQSVLARYEEAPSEDIEDVEAEAEEGAETSPAVRSGPERHQHRAYVESRNFSAAYEAAKKAPDYESARSALERPVATLERGGAPMDFITVSEKERSESIHGRFAGNAGNITVRYKPHWFHVLNAIEHDVASVKSSYQLIDVFRAYFPESALTGGHSIAAMAQHGGVVSLKWGTEFYPVQLDPDGVARGEVFLRAAKTKALVDPAVTIDVLMTALTREWDEQMKNEDEERRKRIGNSGKECVTKSVNRKGEDKDHDAYATKVTSSDKDFQIIAPDGKTQCTTDGCVPMSRSVWEVKTRHEWATSYGLPGAIFAPYFSGGPRRAGQTDPSSGAGRIYKIEEQRQRCLDVTKVCGYQYSYAFESRDAYEFMRKHWAAGGPPVFHR